MSLTSAPRSSVVHIIDGNPGVTYHQTLCGRRIGENWAGEYSEAPSGPVTCKRCERQEGIARTEARFPVGARVGILRGVQAAGGPSVGAYGTVVRVVDTWIGAPDVLVNVNGGELLYTPRLLVTVEEQTARNVRDAESVGLTVPAEVIAEGAAAVQRWAADALDQRDADNRRRWIAADAARREAAFTGRRGAAINARPAVDRRVPNREAGEREAAMLRHPAGKREANESIIAACSARGWHVRRMAPTGDGRFVLMASRRLTVHSGPSFEYVIAVMRPGDAEWSCGSYTADMAQADKRYRSRLAGFGA